VKKGIPRLFLLFSTLLGILAPVAVFAAPFGAGIYSADVPYGSQTSLTIATDGNVSIPVSPQAGGTLATGTSHVTVTSTDVVGYKLYVRALGSSSMDNLGTPLPASANGSPAALAVDTWGYNTDGSSNFVGILTTDTLIKSVTGPKKGGDSTTFTYGVDLDLAKPAGNYSASVLYTAAPQTD
jgi:hypothetical protein